MEEKNKESERGEMSRAHKFDNAEQGRIITFEDKHILEYKDDEEDCDKLNDEIRLDTANLESEQSKHNDKTTENKDQNRFKFKRAKIKVIKRNLRNGACNEEPVNNQECDSSANYELTSFNTNFLTNDSSIFDDTNVFYDRLKIQKKRRILQKTRDEFESRHISGSSRPLNLNTGRDKSNSDSNIYLSLETEFCRKIGNNNPDRINNDPMSRNTVIDAGKHATANSSLLQTKASESLDQNIISDSQSTALKQETHEPSVNEAAEDDSTTKKSDYLNKNILYEEPLDFGISSTLKLLKSRGELSSSSKEELITHKNNTRNQTNDNSRLDPTKSFESDNLVSIFHTDDNGNILNPKEAFKRLCWKFHGQKVNKNKIEKMLRNHLRNNT